MNAGGKDTERLTNELESLKTEEELAKWIEENKIGKASFHDYLYQLSEEKGISAAFLERTTALSKAYIYACFNGTKKPGRKTVLQLALGLGAGLEETNKMLKLAGHKELYARNQEDAVLIFGIRHGKNVYEIDELLEKQGFGLRLADRD